MPLYKFRIIAWVGIWGLSALLPACKSDPKPENNPTDIPMPTGPVRVAPDFNGDSAFQFVKKQVSFGVRVPSSPGHKACGDYITAELKKYGAKVTEQRAPVKTFDGKVHNMRNIIAAFNPDKKKRVMFCTHWDTRPFADQDAFHPDTPIEGANDGGSGTGVLLEVARQLSLKMPYIGVDLIFFDLEDYGTKAGDNTTMEDSYCLGAQYWAKNLHQKDYNPHFGVLLDMVGAPNAHFCQEGTSTKFAKDVVDYVWKTAIDAGCPQFIFEYKPGIIDDHLYINEIAKIPVIDIIEFDPANPHGFSRTWHTHEDNLQHISAQTLDCVGQVVMELIFKEKP